MNVTFEGKVMDVGPILSYGNRGFQKRTVIFEVMEEYGSSMYAVEFAGEDASRIDEENQGMKANVRARVNCRSWKDKSKDETKWFTSLEMVSIAFDGATVGATQAGEEDDLSDIPF